MGPFDHLPTLTDRPAMACPKGKSRLEAKAEEAKEEAKLEQRFLKTVHARDGKTCRSCGIKVLATPALVPHRREVHHIYGRLGRFRFDPLHAIQLCAECHQRVTGKVGSSRLFLVQKAALMLTHGGRSYINASNKVEFARS